MGKNRMSWIGGNRFLSMTEMQNNATLVWDYFNAEGWTINAVCGMLGNMQSESTVNPNIWESLTVNINRGYGLVQWTPSTKYTNWAGTNYAQGGRQCDRIQYECNTNTQWFRNPNAPIVEPPVTFKEFSQSTLDVVTLANYFLWFYEHPAQTIQPQRGTQAMAWFEYLVGVPPKPPVPPPHPDRGEHKMKMIFYLKRKH